MDALALSLWSSEVEPRLTGQRFRESGTHGAWRIGLTFTSDLRLMISLERFHPTLYLTDAPAGRPSGGLPAPMAAALAGTRVTSVSSREGERIARIETNRGSLLIELVPARPALVWMDPAGEIVSSYVNGRGDERLTPGQRYRSPVAPPGVAWPGLDRAIQGAMASPAGESWSAFAARASSFGEFLVLAVKRRHLVSPVPIGEATILSRETTVNAAARTASRFAIETERRDVERRAITDRMRVLERRVTRTLQAVGRDLEGASSWRQWERIGSTLLAHLHDVGRGQSEVTLPDVFDPSGPPLVITIDARLSVSDNAAAYLKRARRGERALPRIRERLAELESELAWIAPRRDRDVDEWTDEDRAQLDRLLVRHHVRGAARAVARAPSRAPRGPASRYHPRRYLSRDGWTILVGRNNDENDWLSLRHAKPDDVWLHAQGVAGSHVLLRRDGRRDNPSRQTLEEAAALAATFSKARHSGSVAVVYTLAKYVRKPRKALPGLVTCTRERTLLVRPANVRDAKHADEETRGAGGAGE